MMKRLVGGDKKGVRLRTIACSIIVAACAVLFVTFFGINQISKKYQVLVSATELNTDAKKSVSSLEYYSDYLTEQAREYVFTMDYEYLEGYFDEVSEGMHREHSLSVLKRQMFKDNKEICNLLDEFMAMSEEMLDAEIHAMRLIVDYTGEDIGSFPERLAQYDLTEEELGYSQEEKLAAAYTLVFGKDYMTLRTAADETMSVVQEKIESVTNVQKEAASAQMLRSIRNQIIYVLIVLVLLIALLLVFIILVLKPIYAIEESMTKQERLKAVGPRELRKLVNAYNHMCEMNAESKVELAHEAEHDGLTGLLNRGAFDKLKGYLQESVEPTALVLLDVDNFKSVNDTYGHQIGDEALKKVAALLKENFGSNDYPARTGGDEFAVLMTHITPKEKGAIRAKITAINEALSKAEGSVPKLSLSAGIAFSQIGYKPALYNMADEALYKTKENGKCGYTFYGDWK